MLLLAGTEAQTLALVKVLVRGAYRVTVCCYHEYLPEVAERFREAGAEVVLLGWERSRSLPQIVTGLRRVFAGLRPDVVHVQYVAPGLAAVLAARLARVPRVLATVHCASHGSKARLFVRGAAALCDAFISVSPSLDAFWFGASRLPEPDAAARWRGHYAIYNCVDVDEIRARANATERDALGASLKLGRGPVVGIVGRVTAQKGQDVLIAALPGILREHPECRVMVVGDGDACTAMQDMARNLRVEEAVRWVGHKRPGDVAALYRAMDVLAVPSRYEGFGLVAAEAMAAGLPVVGTRIEGLADVIVDGETGVLVPKEDPAALSRAIAGLLSDPERRTRMGELGLARVRQFFSLERHERCILAAYASLAGPRTKRKAAE